MPTILYEDGLIIAVDKPSGVTTIPDAITPREASLVGMAEKHCGHKLFVVHRIDKETSGVVLFAKTKEAHRDLNIQFEKRKIIKEYYAVVKGVPDFKVKEVRIPISKSKVGSKKVALSKVGLDARTILKVKKQYKDHALLDVQPITGKRHQIRLHLKAIGFPLAIDPLYGDHGPVNGLKRLSLHARAISFFHPATHRIVKVRSELPEDISSFLKML